MCETSPVVGVWVALGMKTEPTHQPVDGHLPARVLSHRKVILDSATGRGVSLVTPSDNTRVQDLVDLVLTIDYSLEQAALDRGAHR